MVPGNNAHHQILVFGCNHLNTRSEGADTTPPAASGSWAEPFVGFVVDHDVCEQLAVILDQPLGYLHAVKV